MWLHSDSQYQAISKSDWTYNFTSACIWYYSWLPPSNVSVPVQETFKFNQLKCIVMQLKKMNLLYTHLAFSKYAIVVKWLNSIVHRHPKSNFFIEKSDEINRIYQLIAENLDSYIDISYRLKKERSFLAKWDKNLEKAKQLREICNDTVGIRFIVERKRWFQESWKR